MDIKQRIEQYANMKGISIYRLEKDAGMAKSSWNKTKNISSSSCSNLVKIYTDLNAEWLLTGEGEMIKSGVEVRPIHTPSYQEKIEEQASINLYDIEAAANLKTLLANKDENILGKISIPNIPKCDGAVYVRGDSMYPLLKSGDIIAYKEVAPDVRHIIFGEMYLVSVDMDGEEYLTVKYVNKSERGDDWVKLVSYNAHHEPKDFPIEAVRAIAIVKMSIRMNVMR